MRKLTALFLSALMLLGMCTPAFAAAELEDAPFTQEEITQINDPRAVLEKYGTLRIDEQMMTAEGEPSGFAHYQFSLDDQGRVLSNVHLRDGDIEVFANFSVADDMPGSMFWSGNNGQVLYCMPSWEYEQFALDPLGLERGEQTVVDYGVYNGSIILVVATPDPADENARTVTDMFAEEESGLITSKNAVTYVASDGGEVEDGCSHYVYQYGIPYDPEFDETVSEGGAESFCALTLVINPGQDNEETQQLNVALGLEVQFTALEGEDVAIYADEAMTEAVDVIDTSAESATYYITVG